MTTIQISLGVARNMNQDPGDKMGGNNEVVVLIS